MFSLLVKMFSTPWQLGGQPVGEGGDDGAESGTDDDRNGQVDKVALEDEVLLEATHGCIYLLVSAPKVVPVRGGTASESSR